MARSSGRQYNFYLYDSKDQDLINYLEESMYSKTKLIKAALRFFKDNHDKSFVSKSVFSEDSKNIKKEIPSSEEKIHRKLGIVLKDDFK